MRLLLPSSLCAQISQHLAAAYPQEGCGLLIGLREDGVIRVTEIRPAANLNQERPHDRFELDPKVFLQAERELEGRPEEVIGFFHSHPDGAARPSETDRELGWPHYLYLIQSVQQGQAGEVAVWVFKGEGREPQEIELEVRIWEA